MKIKFPAYRIFNKFKAFFVILVILTFLSTGLEAVSIGLIIPLLNSALQSQQPTDSHGWIIEKINLLLSNFNQENLFVTICVFFFLITFVKILTKVMRESLKIILSQKIQVSCQRDMFKKYIDSDLKYLVNQKSGNLIFRMINLPVEVSTYFLLLPSIFVETINILLISILLFSISIALSSGVILVGLIFSISVWYLSKKVFEKFGEKKIKAQSQVNVIANETLNGIREIKVFGNRKQWVRYFWEQCLIYYRIRVKISILRQVPGSVLELVAVGGICLAGVFFGLNSAEETITMLPILAVYAMAIARLIPSFTKLSHERARLSTYIPSVKLYEQAFNEKTIFQTDGSELIERFEKEICFQNVAFKYSKDIPVLENLNLTIPKGKTVAIVGGSGVGKSTIVDLLLGLYDSDSGQILIDGVNLKTLSKEKWRSNIGIVSQNSTIFHTDVKSNITLDSENIDFKRVQEVARLAGVHQFIAQLEHGYDTELGDRGFKLSGGQRQRIAIARAFYREPAIIILDEATSSLDNRTEKNITETMTTFKKGKTVIILAHRLSTIEYADIIYVLKDGKVSQFGTHEELLSQDGEYMELYSKGAH